MGPWLEDIPMISLDWPMDLLRKTVSHYLRTLGTQVLCAAASLWFLQ